jgi:hypothetical protein
MLFTNAKRSAAWVEPHGVWSRTGRRVCLAVFLFACPENIYKKPKIKVYNVRHKWYIIK